MLRFGLPTVPAEVSVFALFFIDRFWLYRLEDPDAAGDYSLSVKLAGVVVFTVRAFQYAWPPLVYSIESDEEASRVYARITTYYVLFTGVVVAGLVLLGRWVVRLFADEKFFGAHEALPWVALGWALYGLFLVLVTMAGRAQVTIRNAPAALCGLAVNVALLALLVPPLGIAGAGIALAGAYVVMLVVMWALIRNLFPVAFEWGRLALFTAIAGGIAVAGELLLPTDGVVGFITRAAGAGRDPGRRSTPRASSGRASCSPRAGCSGLQLPVELLRGLGEPFAAAGEERRRRVLGVALRVVARAARARRPRAARRCTPSGSAPAPRRARCGACACSGRGCARTRRSAASGRCRWRAARGARRVSSGT